VYSIDEFVFEQLNRPAQLYLARALVKPAASPSRSK
jgi:hypothetical protein